MNLMRLHFTTKKLFFIFLLFVFLLVCFLWIKENRVFASSNPYTEEQRDLLFRFGITAPLGINGYDLDAIHALTFLDWGKENLSVPDGVEYIHVLKMRFVPVSEDTANGELDEAAYQLFVEDLPDLVNRNLGSVWIIGNEPDRKEVQDDLTPEIYAERFFEVATIIKQNDSSAKIGFGSIVQPTPIRIRYLEKSLDKLHELALPDQNPMDLIDIWSIHAFILSEVGTWGASIPPGFDCNIEDCSDSVLITDFSDTYSIETFIERIKQFRTWLKQQNEDDKPLWITEYGSLFYYWEVVCSENVNYDCNEPYNGWPTEQDTINYMISTFNFLMAGKDDATGFSLDDHKLVQRWYWYSLNDHLNSFGGSLYDPDNNKQITKLGIAYKNYIELLIGPKTYLPIIQK